MLSQGVPSLNGRDEFARSQRGNNNAYCQNNKLTWVDWNLDEPRKRLLDFTSRLIHFRLAHPNLHRRRFFQDREIRKRDGNVVVHDIAWLNPDGNQVSDEVWSTGWMRSIALLLNGQTLQITDEEGRAIIDDNFLIIVNAADAGVEFALPPAVNSHGWSMVMDTENIGNPFAETKVGEKVIAGERSLKLLSDELFG
jgi:glycogen operon protein